MTSHFIYDLLIASFTFYKWAWLAPGHWCNTTEHSDCDMSTWIIDSQQLSQHVIIQIIINACRIIPFIRFMCAHVSLRSMFHVSFHMLIVPTWWLFALGCLMRHRTWWSWTHGLSVGIYYIDEWNYYKSNGMICKCWMTLIRGNDCSQAPLIMEDAFISSVLFQIWLYHRFSVITSSTLSPVCSITQFGIITILSRNIFYGGKYHFTNFRFSRCAI